MSLMKREISFVRVLFVSLFIVIFDQVTKFLIKGGIIPIVNIKADGMSLGQSINVFGDFFKVTFVENPGIAFGIDVNDISKLFLSIFSLLASLGILYYMWRSKEQKLVVRIAFAFILGGAIGNFIDRAFYGLFYGYAPLFYGKVVDFLNFDFFDITILGRTYDRFPIFNIADSAVTIGVCLLLIFYRTKEEVKPEAVTGTDSLQISDSTPLVAEQFSETEEKNTKAENGENSNREENKD
jgi:signal peptidase II